jgi:hypothetical protein
MPMKVLQWLLFRGRRIDLFFIFQVYCRRVNLQIKLVERIKSGSNQKLTEKKQAFYNVMQ